LHAAFKRAGCSTVAQAALLHAIGRGAARRIARAWRGGKAPLHNSAMGHAA
jgi:hypothetical protein